MTTTTTTTAPATGAFPAGHYGCPPWCELGPAGHDSDDLLPADPGHEGYHHYRMGFTIDYAASWISTDLSLGAGDSEPSIEVAHPQPDGTDLCVSLTLAQAAALRDALADLLAAAGHLAT
jgi:hypothetical protein